MNTKRPTTRDTKRALVRSLKARRLAKTAGFATPETLEGVLSNARLGSGVLYDENVPENVRKQAAKLILGAKKIGTKTVKVPLPETTRITQSAKARHDVLKVHPLSVDAYKLTPHQRIDVVFNYLERRVGGSVQQFMETMAAWQKEVDGLRKYVRANHDRAFEYTTRCHTELQVLIKTVQAKVDEQTRNWLAVDSVRAGAIHELATSCKRLTERLDAQSERITQLEKTDQRNVTMGDQYFRNITELKARVGAQSERITHVENDGKATARRVDDLTAEARGLRSDLELATDDTLAAQLKDLRYAVNRNEASLMAAHSKLNALKPDPVIAAEVERRAIVEDWFKRKVLNTPGLQRSFTGEIKLEQGDRGLFRWLDAPKTSVLHYAAFETVAKAQDAARVAGYECSHFPDTGYIWLPKKTDR